MIRPRPTKHVNGTGPNSFHTFTSNPAYAAQRPPAWCPCGAKLSFYRGTGEILCAPCQLAKAPTIPPIELHPDPPIKDRWRTNQSKTCPICGGIMDRRAKLCRSCLHPNQQPRW